MPKGDAQRVRFPEMLARLQREIRDRRREEKRQDSRSRNPASAFRVA